MVAKENQKIWTTEIKAEKTFLKKKARSFDFSQYSKKDIDNLVLFLRTMMVRNHGVGLAAPQIGLGLRVFVAQLPSEDGRGYKGKFYAIFNPEIESISKKTIAEKEGCLSIPGYYGTVERAEKIVISGFDKNNRKIRVKAQGFLAIIFQHETDHLNGVLFADKSKDLEKLVKEQ
jgi:peptide deformylase